MTLLSVIENVCDESGYDTAPAAVITSASKTTKQMLTLTMRIARRIRDRWPWRELTAEHEITLVDSQADYALPGSFSYELANTFWNRSTAWRVLGPINAAEWRLNQEGSVTPSITENYRIRGLSSTQLMLTPTPTSSEAGEILIFEHLTKNCWRPADWANGAAYSAGSYCFYDGTIYKTNSAGTSSGTNPSDDVGVLWSAYTGVYDEPQADSDVFVLGEHLLEMGVIAYFSKAKVFADYPAAQAEFWGEVDAAFRKQAPAAEIPLGREAFNWPNMVDTGLTIEGSGG